MKVDDAGCNNETPYISLKISFICLHTLWEIFQLQAATKNSLSKIKTLLYFCAVTSRCVDAQTGFSISQILVLR